MAAVKNKVRDTLDSLGKIWKALGKTDAFLVLSKDCGWSRGQKKLKKQNKTKKEFFV